MFAGAGPLFFIHCAEGWFLYYVAAGEYLSRARVAVGQYFGCATASKESACVLIVVEGHGFAFGKLLTAGLAAVTSKD